LPAFANSMGHVSGYKSKTYKEHLKTVVSKMLMNKLHTGYKQEAFSTFIQLVRMSRTKTDYKLETFKFAAPQINL